MPAQPLNPRNGYGPLPLVLGVTGHRDLRKEDIEPLKQQVRFIFAWLAEKYPFTPLQLISGLAEGADRLAAQVALECNVSLVACLPMEKSLYETDFDTGESRREFEELLAKAARVIALPLAAGAAVEQVKTHGPRRDAQYDALGKYLVAQSQILIALWDGVDARLTGGTSEVVRMQLGAQLDGGDIDPDHPLDLPETGPVFHIVTPRIKNPSPAGRPCETRKLWHMNPAFSAAEDSYLRIYRRIDTFNRDAVEKGEKLKAACEQSKEWVFPEKARAVLEAPVVSMLEHYALADALAIHYQSLTRMALQALIFWTGLAVVFLFECFAHCPESIQIWALSLYVIIIVTTYAAYQVVKPGEFKTKYLDYRALAEGLRAQMFWRIAGIGEQVADYYLRKQKTELDWVRSAIRVWNTEAGESRGAPDFPLVQARWIEDQLKFFTKACKRVHHRHQAEKHWTFGIILTTLAIALFHLILTWRYGDRFTAVMARGVWKGGIHDTHDMELRGVIVIIMAVLPAVAGAIAAYSLKMAVSEQEKQYRRMQNLFKRGSDCMKQALKDNNANLAVKTIFDLGKAALEENGDWVVLHRERSVEVHLGG